MQRRDFLAAAAVGVASRGVLGKHAGFTGFGSVDPTGPINAAAFHAMRKFAATRFGRIAYIERGKGDAALFLHGDPLNSYQWRGALERLSPVRRCIALDFMGLGYGEIPANQGLAPEDQVEMCAAVLDHLSIKSVDLIGSDSGGAVAQIFTARYPTRVRSLLLTNCDTYDDSPPEVLKPIIAGSRAGTLVDESLVPWLADKSKARVTLGTAFTSPASLTDESVEVYIRPATISPLRKAQYHGYQIGLDHNALLPVLPALRKSSVPVQVIWGTGDDIFKPTGPETLADLFPKFQGVRRVDGAKLFFPEEYPDIIAEEARKLWART